jgi:hypothetical protein
MLKPGGILLIDCSLVDPPHDKFVVVLCLEPKPLFAFINSKIRPFIQARQSLLDAQVEIDCRNHRCLHHDSYVDCSEPFTWEAKDFEDQLQREPYRNKGLCSRAVLIKVLEAVEAATTISSRDKVAIATALTPFIESE